MKKVLIVCLCALVLSQAGWSESETFAMPDIDALEAAPIQLVNQDLDPALLENLPAPATPPPQIRLPAGVVKSNEWRGSQSGITSPAVAVFRQQDKWEKFWTLAMKPYDPRLKDVPAVDFSKQMVVAVFLGQNLYPTSEIEIKFASQEIHAETESLIVRYRIRKKMQAVFSPPFAVQPYHLKAVPQHPEKVLFLLEKR